MNMIKKLIAAFLFFAAFHFSVGASSAASATTDPQIKARPRRQTRSKHANPTVTQEPAKPAAKSAAEPAGPPHQYPLQRSLQGAQPPPQTQLQKALQYPRHPQRSPPHQTKLQKALQGARPPAPVSTPTVTSGRAATPANPTSKGAPVPAAPPHSAANEQLLRETVTGALDKTKQLCDDIAQQIRTRFIQIDSVISESFGANIEGRPVVLIVTKQKKKHISPDEFSRRIIPEIEKQIGEIARDRLVFVVFNEMFFCKGVLTEEDVNEYLAQLRYMSTRHKNVILIPHFLYKTSGTFMFNDGFSDEFLDEFLDEYKKKMNFFQKGGRARFKAGKNLSLKYGTSTGWQFVSMVSHADVKPSSIECDIQQDIITKAECIIRERRPFNFLRSISYMIYGGELLCSYKKAGYCFEDNKMLKNENVLYDFGTGQTELCLCRSCKQHFVELAQVLRDECKINICFDLRLRASGIFSDYERQDKLHIIQSNTIFPACSLFSASFPPGTLVVHSDARYQCAEPKFHAFIFNGVSKYGCAYRPLEEKIVNVKTGTTETGTTTETETTSASEKFVTISVCDFF